MNDALPLTSTETKQLQSVRWFTRMLMMSGCANFIALLIGLYGYFVGSFWLPPHQMHRPQSMQEGSMTPSLTQTLHHFQLLSSHQLVECLAEAQCVEEGYRICDLALGYLVGQHHFDLARALQPLPSITETTLSLSINGELRTLPLYLGLTPFHYNTILAFGRREQWPITPEAMFWLLKDPKTATDRSLRDSFCLCAPVQLLQKSLLGSKVLEGQEAGWSLSFCLDRLLEGDWQQLLQSSRTVAQQAGSIHLARQSFLACYPPEKEQKKDLLCLQAAKEVAPKSMVIRPSLAPAIAPTTTARGSKVQRDAQPLAKRPTSAAHYSIPKLYVVRQGDSLWKIARAFQVDIEKIKSYNALQTDRIRPGSSLLIP